MTVRKLRQKRGWAWNLAVPIIKPLLLATTRQQWINGERIPATGGCILVINHISHLDPLTAAHIVYDHGRLPRYLAKSSIFKNRVANYFFTSAGQIPVERLTRNAVGAYDAAVAAVRSGECVVVYPEGTLSRDPDLWPMVGKSGAARIALETRCPVIPVGQWGAQELLAPYSNRLRVFPRKLITMKVGAPVDLSDLTQRPQTPEMVQQATDRIMAAITTLVEEIRGATAPAERFDMRKAGVRPIGNPNKSRSKKERP